MTRTEKTRPYLELAARILESEEREREVDEQIQALELLRDEIRSERRAMLDRWDARVEDAVESTASAEAVDPEGADTNEAVDSVPPWQDTDASNAERVRRYFRAHPYAEMTARELEQVTGVKLPNINQVLSRGRRTDKNPDGFFERPRTGVYRLTDRSRAWALAQAKKSAPNG